MKMSFNILTHVLLKMTFPPQKLAALVYAITVNQDWSFQGSKRWVTKVTLKVLLLVCIRHMTVIILDNRQRAVNHWIIESVSCVMNESFRPVLWTRSADSFKRFDLNNKSFRHCYFFHYSYDRTKSVDHFNYTFMVILHPTINLDL